MSNIKFTGIMPALVTPLNADETINRDVAERLMKDQMANGMDGFYVCGGTGEGPIVAPSARKEMAEITRDVTKGKGKCIVHVGAVDLKTAVDLAKHSAEIGADAISSVPPFFFHYNEKEIEQYYHALADACGLPVLMYASPLAGVNITVEMIDRFMKTVPNLIGLKWTSADYYTMHRIKELNGGDINVINGPDEMLSCGLVMGADGGIGGTYATMPKKLRAIYDYFKAGDIPAMQKVQFEANRLIEVIIRYGVVPSVRQILKWNGFDCGHSVYPAPRMTEENAKLLRADLDALGYEENYL
ncbi:MAG: dihydrodipicolinate synthase family protein [Clostridia bacterium]|nr:dihydrodipicolinate synthase family protein [Clostridia bacterium]